MKLGIVGLSFVGKSTLFSALTGRPYIKASPTGKVEIIQGVVPVPDERLDWLEEQYKPRKKVPATVTYLDFQVASGEVKDRKGYVSLLLNHVRPLDALVMVVRNFHHPVLGAPKPLDDFKLLEEEFIISDLATVEKRLERIEQEKKKGHRISEIERELLVECSKVLSREEPLRKYPNLAGAQELRGFTFLSAKPLLVVLNNEDDDQGIPVIDFGGVEVIPVRARLEMEIMQLPPEDVESFKESFGVETLAKDRVIKKSYEILNLLTFFTIGDDEVRAWTIPKGSTVLKAAGTIHSDMEKGFIRAEVISFEELKKVGSYLNAKKEGLLRLEGKDYIVSEGDIIQIRFSPPSSRK